MGGTSLDGLDVVLADIQGFGLKIKAQLLGQISIPLGDLAGKLRTLASGQAAAAIDYLRAGRELGHLHAQAIESLLERCLPSGRRVDLVVAHGQTIWHAPQEHLSWQLFDPWPIVHRLNLPVLSDLRQADLIARGQGAPITPLADWILYGRQQQPRVIANLGGICNLTFLPGGSEDSPPGIGAIRGADIGPCNLLLDGLAKKVMGVAFDRDGIMAARGGISSIVYRLILQSDFYQRPEPRTTGREDFSSDWVDRIAQESGLKAYDLLASAVDAVARILADAVTRQQFHRAEVVLAGGGARHHLLVRRIQHHLGDQRPVLLSDALGISLESREALAMALLGALCMDGLAITLPTITGASASLVAGSLAGIVHAGVSGWSDR